MRRAAMAKDFGWAESAAAYAALYRRLGEARLAETAPAPANPPPRPPAKRAAARAADDESAASRADARALQRLAAAAATSLTRRPARS